MATPIAVPTPYLPINPYVVPGSQTQPVDSWSNPIQSTSTGGVKFDTGQVLPAYAVQGVPQTTYSTVAQAQTTNANPTKPTGYQTDSGFDMKYYPGWDETAARADWTATGGAKASNYQDPGTANSPSAPAPPATRTYNVGGTPVEGEASTSGAIRAVEGLFPTSDYGNYANQFNPEEFFKIIDENYAATEKLHNENQSALEAANAQFGKQIESDYGANLARSQAAKTSTEQKLAQNEVSAEQRKQDALNAARQLYNDLRMGYRQRFGGATSAGEAAQALLGQEQQRQSGQIGRTHMNSIAEINNQKVDLKNNFDAAVKELDSQKQAALSQVQQTFVTNLTQINNNRALSQQAKAQAKMQVLENARNATLQIAQQREQFKQQLQLNVQQQALALDTAHKQMQMQAGTYTTNAQNAVNKIPTTVKSSITPSNVTTSRDVLASSQNQPIYNSVGQIDPNNGFTSTKNWWEA